MSRMARRGMVTYAGRALLAIAAGTLAGCIFLKDPPSSEELGTQVLPEKTPLPAGWTAKGAGAGQVENGWLATFADPQLDAMVAEALESNVDLRIAAARVEQA